MLESVPTALNFSMVRSLRAARLASKSDCIFFGKRFFLLFGADTDRHREHHNVNDEHQTNGQNTKSHAGVFKQQITQTVGFSIRKVQLLKNGIGTRAVGSQCPVHGDVF